MLTPLSTPPAPTPGVLYEVTLLELLEAQEGAPGPYSQALLATMKNGRSSYIFFENFARSFFSLLPAHQSDHQSQDGTMKYEQKSYVDATVLPKTSYCFHTASSSTFGANNKGPAVKKLLQEGRRGDALTLCKQCGYDKNDYYLYTNTGRWLPTLPLRMVLLPTTKVLSLLEDDPRLISRQAMLATVSTTRHFLAAGTHLYESSLPLTSYSGRQLRALLPPAALASGV